MAGCPRLHGLHNPQALGSPTLGDRVRVSHIIYWRLPRLKDIHPAHWRHPRGKSLAKIGSVTTVCHFLSSGIIASEQRRRGPRTAEKRHLMGTWGGKEGNAMRIRETDEGRNDDGRNGCIVFYNCFHHEISQRRIWDYWLCWNLDPIIGMI
jgi:hypothetical protein